MAMGQYLANEALGVSAPFNPIAVPSIDSRPWTDKNGDRTLLNKDGTPQLDEISPGFNPNFGSSVLTNYLDPNTPRGRNREYSAGVERQLMAGWSISGMWHRRSYYNYRWVDDQDASASDYNLIPFTIPVSPALPDGGGQAVPVYGFKPGFVFKAGNLLTTPAPDDFRSGTEPR